MIYSRLLYTEYEQAPNENGEGSYTIFSTQQTLDVNFVPLDVVCIQEFAVLWDEPRDVRLIALIEQSIVIAQLSPVKLLHATEGVLTIVYDSNLVGEALDDFHEIWEELADDVIDDLWTVNLIKDIDTDSHCDSSRPFRQYAPGVLTNNSLGITSFTSDMCFFKDEWKPRGLYPYLGPSI